MSDDDSKDLKKFVDGSGFPLQVKIEGVINQTPNWTVEGREVFWENRIKDGFIDIVANHSKSQIKLFVEVKKKSGGAWIFLSHESKGKRDERAITLTVNNQNTQFEWNEIILPISTEKFSFCAVMGQKNPSNPLLERLGSELIMSMEGYLLNQDLRTIRWNNEDNYGLPNFPSAISVIVTNTNLYKCYYDAETVDLSDGVIKGDTDFEEVKYLAFTKPLWSKIEKSNKSPGYLSRYQINEQQDRTVFVVSSNYLREFLIDLDPFQA